MFVNRLFDIVSFSGSPGVRYLYILVLSVISAVIFLLLFKRFSNQERIAYHKRKIWGNILQIRVYQDKFTLLILSVFNIIKHNLLYLLHMVVPLLVIMIPLIVFTVQVNTRCGYEPLNLNQRFVIRGHLDPKSASGASLNLLEEVYCEVPQGIELETLPLRIEETGEVFWRARVASLPASQVSVFIRIGVRGDAQIAEKLVATDYDHKRFAPGKNKWSFRNELFGNAEGFLARDGIFDVVSIGYQRASYAFLLWKVDAVILYFVWTFLLAFVLKGFVDVTI